LFWEEDFQSLCTAKNETLCLRDAYWGGVSFVAAYRKNHTVRIAMLIGQKAGELKASLDTFFCEP